ncbi:MAG: cysteine--tRNA ligase, partial [Clostridia bacterium]|nr:cysteine--tRNA ligase [Clostridia bacterium]
QVENEKFNTLKKLFTDALDNDMNTSLAITALYDVLKADANPSTKLALIEDFDRVLTLDLLSHAEKVKDAGPKADGDLAAEVEALIKQRAEAKKAKNFAEADRIRNYLAEKGVILVDSREGTTWKLEG